MNQTTFSELEKKLKRKLKNTAKFYRVDIHSHSPLSPDFGRKDRYSEADVKASPKDIAEAACKKELYILAVTDHHRSENASRIASATDEIRKSGKNIYPNNNLLVLPGMEITVEEAGGLIHLLAIFPEGTNSSQIERVVDDTGLEPDSKDRKPDSKVTHKRLIELIRRIKDRGGLAILAHVNSNNGYRFEMKKVRKSDEEIIKAISNFEIDAVEISKPSDEVHFVYQGKQIPCVIGSDAHHLEQIGSKGNITRVKMTDPSFKDLKRAIQDSETRIRFEDPQIVGIKHIIGVNFDGGFLDGQAVAFTSNLNGLIGGRGTGKSTLIEAIRYIFECRVPEGRKKDVNTMLSEVLKDCTITLLFEDQFREKYVLQRTYGDTETKIMTIDGLQRGDTQLSVSQNLRLSIYGWSEIERIARDERQQLELLDNFIEEVPQLKREEEGVIYVLEANARETDSILRSIAQEEKCIGNLVELEQELKKLGEEEKEEEKQKTKSDNEKVAITTIEENISILIDRFDSIKLEKELTNIIDAIEKAKKENSIFHVELFNEIVSLIRQTVKKEHPLITAEMQLREHLKLLRNQIGTEFKQLRLKHQQIDQKFQQLLEELMQPDLKRVAQRRVQLRDEIRRRKESVAKKVEAEAQLEELRKQRKTIILKLLEIRKKLYKMRLAHVAEISDQLPKGKSNVKIDIRIKEQCNRKDFMTLLNTKLTGLRRNWRDKKFPLKISDHFTPIEFARLLREENQDLLKKAEFSSEEAKDIINHFKDKELDFMEIEVCSCFDLPLILLDVEGQKRLIQKLSPGQRCTALLPIILLETDTPLIIDQPEDNLDNQFIFALVVNTMRKLKDRRQIIVATHNPNIPVSGDAENILVFKAEGSKGKIDKNGSIDYSPIIRDVENIMEGGKEAFRVRAQKYGIPKRS